MGPVESRKKDVLLPFIQLFIISLDREKNHAGAMEMKG